MTKKILIVDDEEGIRESLKLILGDEYDLLLAEDGPQALEILDNAAEQIGLILLDIKMPRINGLDLLREIKTRHPHHHAVMITGYKSVETAAEASSLGATSYIVKPFDSKEILETVRRNLG